MPLEYLEVFKERTQGMSGDEIEQELQTLANGVMGIMSWSPDVLGNAVLLWAAEGLANFCHMLPLTASAMSILMILSDIYGSKLVQGLRRERYGNVVNARDKDVHLQWH